ncbi:MAG: hypothetical protein AB8G16_16235 [Gammaproteobacteria bacterium]
MEGVTASPIFAGRVEVLKAQDQALEAIARAVGARPIGGAITIGGGSTPNQGAQAGGEAQLQRTEAIANLDLRELSFSDAASILSVARDPSPASSQTSNHESALLGATLAAQGSIAAQAQNGQTANDHLAVLADYYAQHV